VNEGRLALVADYLIFFRGAERTFAQMAECWPRAPIHTIAYRAGATGRRFDGRRIQTSFMQRLGLNRHWYRYALPLLPRAAESLDVGGYSTIVSSSFGFAHGVRPGSGAVHVCYCHSPFRQAWHERERALATTPRWARGYARRTLDSYRRWDLDAAHRVTHYVANSEITARRIADLYGREAPVLHPPVETERFEPGEPEDYFLYVGELVSHKRPAVAVEAARLARVPLVVVGDGPERRRLQALSSGSIRLLGRIDDQELAGLYARARALIVPNVEEFGIAAVEAQAAGRPVLALGEGGALETVVDGVTGTLVAGGNPADFAEAMREVAFERFDPAAARENAERFNAATFRRRLQALVHEASAVPTGAKPS
jgi:glycosyltransferase involved in cell wall biosynthesis